MATFTINELWQMFLAMCGAIATIAGAGIIIYKIYKAAKQPDNERDKALKEHQKKLDNCNQRLNSVEDGQAVMMEAVLAIMNHLIDGGHKEDLQKATNKVNSYLINQKTDILRREE